MSLQHQLYNGLPPRIKDEISRVGKPDNLTDLCLLAQSIDARYWERRLEIARKMPANKPQDKSSDKGKTSATLANQNTDHRNLPKSGQSGPSWNTPAPTTPSTPKPTSNLTLKLRKMEGSLRKKDNTAWTTTCAYSAANLVTLPRNV